MSVSVDKSILINSEGGEAVYIVKYYAGDDVTLTCRPQDLLQTVSGALANVTEYNERS